MHSRIAPSPGRRLLARSGTMLVLSYVLFYVTQQSHTLWSRSVPLPGGEDGPFGAFRKLFPPGWLYASRELEIGLANALIYILLIVWVFGIYLFAVKKAFQPGAFKDHDRHEHRGNALIVILITTALMLIVLVMLPGTFSTDMHSYVWYGRIFAIYGDNPFTNAPIEYAARDEGGWLELVYWTEVPSVYGPAWVWLAGGIAVVAEWLGGGIGTHLMGHRLLAAFAHLGNSLLIWRVAGLMLGRYGCHFHLQPDGTSGPTPFDRREGRQVATTLAYAWNPLALIEFGANGHNDVLLLTGLLACLWLHLLRHWRLALVALAAAALVKAIALIWIPGYLWLLLWDQPEQGSRTRYSLPARLGMVGQGIAITTCTWVVAYLPFWEGPATLQPLAGGPAATRMINSLGQFAYLKLPEGVQHLRGLLGWELMDGSEINRFASGLFDPIRGVALLLSLVAMVVSTWRARDLVSALGAWGWGGFAYLIVGAVWFWPWYVSWLLVPVALVGWGRLLLAVQLLCASSLTLYAIYPDVPTALKNLLTWRALVVIAPALVYSIYSFVPLARHRLRRRRSLSRTVAQGERRGESERAVA